MEWINSLEPKMVSGVETTSEMNLVIIMVESVHQQDIIRLQTDIKREDTL